MNKDHSEGIGAYSLRAVSLSGIDEIRDGVFLLRWIRQHDFVAGQVLAITLDEAIPPRLFSICSGQADLETAIFFNVKPDGILSPRLAKLKKGDQLLISPPFGTFRGDRRPAWWIAAGTGIAPFRAMLRSGLAEDQMLIHGGRTPDQFYFESEMLAAFGKRYVRCCSQEAGEGLFYGRLTQWLREYPQLPPACRYYLCGSAEMIVEVRDILIGNGIVFDNIHSEIYF